MTNQSQLSVCYGIATANRREVLSDTLKCVEAIGGLPDEIIISPMSDQDVDFDVLSNMAVKCRVVVGPAGAAAQRNTIIKKCNSDVVVFLDDDFLPDKYFVRGVREIFQQHKGVVAATGVVIADGILTEGISHADAMAILTESTTDCAQRIEDVYSAYGCNMAVRMSLLEEASLLFDEDLPLYSWLEDLDLSRRLANHGKVVKYSEMKGVHLGTKRAGRSPGKQLGYSQISNPIYLARKGTMSWDRSVNQMYRNILANLVRSFYPEPWIDRRGRLKGNLKGIFECFSGRLHPTRILEFK